MALETALVTYVVLLAISPIAGMYALKFVYPDVKTYVQSKKWALFVIFGLIAYLPAAVVSLLEIAVPIYSPAGASPLLFESEGSMAFTFALFGLLLAVNSSVVDFVIVRRKTTTIVGIPKHVIRYKINHEIAKSRELKKHKEVTRITKDLEGVIKEEKDMGILLEKIRNTVSKEREAARAIKLQGPEEAKKIERLGVDEASKERFIKQVETANEELPELFARKDALIHAPKKEEGKLPQLIAEREKLVKKLEDKLKKATGDMDKKERTQALLGELRGALSEEHKEVSGLGDMYKEDVDEISRALRDMRKETKEREKEEEHVREHRKKPDEEVGESLVTYQRAHPESREDDVLKAVLGDVRQQLEEPKRAAGKEVAGGKRWYEGGQIAERPGMPMPKEEPKVEMFEEGLSFGEEGLEGFGDLGELGGELGDLSDLESMDQDLSSSEFDGMFVDMGPTKNTCPNCGKKGTSVVYCSSCGKPLCSNCAKSVEGSESFVKYKCPHCQEEFAVKRRVPA